MGEYFVFPALTTSGACEIMVFEGIPGGPMDCWGDVTTPAEHLERANGCWRRSCRGRPSAASNIELTDDNGILAGRFPPTVRKPVGELPSGALVLGLADAVVLNDPITGPGLEQRQQGRGVLPREHCANTVMGRTTARSWSRRSSATGTTPST